MKICDIYSTLVHLGLAQFRPHLARRKAFLIGVESGPPEPVSGSHRDVRRFRMLLMKSFGFESNDIIMMLDDGVETPPTEANIMATLKTFLAGQHPGDLFIFAYAGHGDQIKCDDGTEEDGLNERIITCDARNPDGDYAIILDDVLHDYLVKRLLPGSRLIAFLDVCHSETLLDLKHYRCNRLSRFRRSVRRLREITGFPASRVTETVPDNRVATHFCSGYCQRINTGSCAPNVVCISACKDSQEILEGLNASMLHEIINQLEIDACPKLKKLMRALSKSAKGVHRLAIQELRHRKKAKDARQKAKDRRVKQQKPQMSELNSSSESESDTETVDEREVARWAPQISSMAPLRMGDRLSLY